MEGFTNLLWTLLVAGGLALGLEARAVGHALGLASGVAVLGLAWAFARRGLAAEDRAWAALAPCAVALALPFGFWTTSGMETPLFAALATAALLAQARDRPGWAAAAAFAATLTRPEGAMLGAVVLGASFLERWPRERWRAARAPLVFAGLLAALTAFRLAYYGVPLPNTFYVKVGDAPVARGVAYVASFFAAGAWLLLFPALRAVGRDRRLLPGAAFAALLAVYAVAVGGDAFPHGRFLLPLLPVLAGLAACGAVGGSGVARAVAAASVAAALAWQAFGLGLGPDAGGPGTPRTREMERLRSGFAGVEARGRARAERLRAQAPEARLVAAGAIGALGYHSRLPILDIYGLVDAHIAREGREPDGMAPLPAGAASSSRRACAPPSPPCAPRSSGPVTAARTSTTSSTAGPTWC